jgi:hypothetical protein
LFKRLPNVVLSALVGVLELVDVTGLFVVVLGAVPLLQAAIAVRESIPKTSLIIVGFPLIDLVPCCCPHPLEQHHDKLVFLSKPFLDQAEFRQDCSGFLRVEQFLAGATYIVGWPGAGGFKGFSTSRGSAQPL